METNIATDIHSSLCLCLLIPIVSSRDTKFRACISYFIHTYFINVLAYRPWFVLFKVSDAINRNFGAPLLLVLVPISLTASF